MLASVTDCCSVSPQGINSSRLEEPLLMATNVEHSIPITTSAPIGLPDNTIITASLGSKQNFNAGDPVYCIHVHAHSQLVA